MPDDAVVLDKHLAFLVAQRGEERRCCCRCRCR
jgi:hypothetical protein